MTYLQIVNHILRRLREDEVTSVNQTTYSKMVGDFVNDAKALVESAYDWAALRTTYTIDTEENVFSYALTGAGQNLTELRFINDTSNLFMRYKTQAWFDNVYLNVPTKTGSPEYWTYNGVDSSGDTLIDIYPIPDGVYTLRFNAVTRNSPLVDNTDEISIPYLPVLHMAIALLARERGETGGTTVAEYFGIADKFLADAISYDAAKHPEENTFVVV